jgi:Lrp/AsnC family transcriptional regulator for asnA, asnC and gidA
MRPRVDQTDRAILRLLMEDGRMPSAEISRRLGCISARAVSDRIKRLTESGIVRVQPVVKPKSLGYTIAADFNADVSLSGVTEVAEAIAKLDTVYYVATIVGQGAVTFSVNAADVEDLQSFIRGHLEAIPGIEKVRTFLIGDILKESRDWQIPDKLP